MHISGKIYGDVIYFKVAKYIFSGGNFCAGYDLKALSEVNSDVTLPTDVELANGLGPMVSKDC